MQAIDLTAIVSLILALSVAAERLVEIVKGVIPWLGKERAEEYEESLRRTALQVLAVAAGVATAYLSRPHLPAQLVEPAGDISVLGLGLLASGGSGFWNAVLTYVASLKELKRAEARKAAA